MKGNDFKDLIVILVILVICFVVFAYITKQGG